MKKLLLILLLFVSVSAVAQRTDWTIDWNQVKPFAVNVRENTTTNSGAYLQFAPPSYTPNLLGPCQDIYGNAIEQPITVPGTPSIGYSTNEILSTNVGGVLPSNT